MTFRRKRVASHSENATKVRWYFAAPSPARHDCCEKESQQLRRFPSPVTERARGREKARSRERGYQGSQMRIPIMPQYAKYQVHPMHAVDTSIE